jgi:DNA-binding protein H-NS
MRGCRSLKVTSAEKARLNQRLRQLDLGVAPHHVEKMSHARRPYPQVFPKYRNPAEPTETWAGRGKKPRWLTAQLETGKQIDDFRIQRFSRRLIVPRGAAQGNDPHKQKIQPRVICLFGF